MSRGNRSRPAHERTAEERERDRLERERRRGVPAAQPPDAEQPAPEPPDAEQPRHELPATESHVIGFPEDELEYAAPLAAEREQPDPAADPGPPTADSGQPLADPDPPGAELEPSAAPIPAPAPAAAADGLDPGDHDREYHEAEEILAPEPAWHVEDAESAPPAPGEPARAYRSARVQALAQAGAGVASRGALPSGRGPGRAKAGGSSRPGRGGRRLTRARGAALLALAAAVVLVWFLISLFQPFAGSGGGRVIVQIPKGSSSSKVGSILAHDGVVSSGFFFNLRALLEGKRSSLHSGRFQLERDMSYAAAIEALSKPPPRVIAVKVVIPEGYTRRQIAELVGEDALSGDYLAATKRSAALDPAHYGAPAGTRDLEGFLFPATYDLTAGSPVKKLVDEQLSAFRARFTAADVRRAHALGVTPYQLLTVASMIEREAQSDHDRPLIAAVIYNRLKEGIPLGIDATIYYAVELQKNIATYTGELTESQLKIDSPYNSRTHKGLPPTPISNPGEASIRAAAHPSQVPYLYYVAGADGCGEQVFSKTYAEFQKNVDAYDAAVKKNGGHPPACKKR